MLTVLAYWPVFSADFVNFDDPKYVIDNPHVLGGLTWSGWRWAWTSLDMYNWHPLTWLSWQLDVQLFGARPAVYHATNLVLHLANVLLLYGWVCGLLRSRSVALFSAALFAVHPLHVESVAWISERKDVLSSMFGLASLWAYTAYARVPRRSRLALAWGLFALSLLAKPMWVTLPFLLMLLDVWPLERVAAVGSAPAGGITWKRVLAEKIPFLLLTFISCAVTLYAQKSALRTWEFVPFGTRLGTAVTACVIYLRQTVHPAGLAVFYPYPKPAFGWATILGATALLLAITLWSTVRFRRQPGLLIGWLWFLGALAPVIGIVQVGDQAYADRYTYLPHIGLIFAWSYELARLASWSPKLARNGPVLAGLAVIACAVITRFQAAHWQNSEALWRQALAVTTNNVTAHSQIGVELVEQNRYAEAQAEFEQAARLQPDVVLTHFNLGVVCNLSGQFPQAEQHFREALRIDPDSVNVRLELGTVLAMNGRTAEAIPHLKEAAQRQPQNLVAWRNLARAQRLENDLSGAISSYEQILARRPDDVPIRIELAATEFDAGRTSEARRDYARSLELDPGWPTAMNAEAWHLATHPSPFVRDGQAAVDMARKVCQATQDSRAEFLDTLAAAFAEAGRFDEAIATVQRSVSRYAELGHHVAASAASERLKHYQAGQPWREASSAAGRHRALPAFTSP